MKTLLVISDTHINSTVGLALPGFTFDDGQAKKLSRLQRKIWRNWEDSLVKAEKLKQGELIVVFNGDTVETDSKKRTSQLMTTNEVDVGAMAKKVFEPVCQMADKTYWVRGTPAHGGNSSKFETAVADNFDNTVKDPDTGSSTWWWLPLQIEKVKFDIMHHPKSSGIGRMIYSQGVVDRLATDTMIEYSGEELPDVVIRSHIHVHLDSHDAFKVRAITTPAWSLLTEYGYRKGISHQSEIGSLLFLVDGDQIEKRELTYEIVRKKWQKA